MPEMRDTREIAGDVRTLTAILAERHGPNAANFVFEEAADRLDLLASQSRIFTIDDLEPFLANLKRVISQTPPAGRTAEWRRNQSRALLQTLGRIEEESTTPSSTPAPNVARPL
jgi:hypothetical protein